jgi:hypothetical protein
LKHKGIAEDKGTLLAYKNVRSSLINFMTIFQKRKMKLKKESRFSEKGVMLRSIT